MSAKFPLETYLNSYLEFCADHILTPEGMVTLRANVAEALAAHDAKVIADAKAEGAIEALTWVIAGLGDNQITREGDVRDWVSKRRAIELQKGGE